MKNDRAVVNASPLIILFRANLEWLLPQIFAEILVPGAVWHEITAGGKTDRAARELLSVDWVKRVEVVTIPSIVAAWNLGEGESEVLSLSLDRRGSRAILDDSAARRCAMIIGIPTLGTGGIVVLAKRRGLITSVSSALEALHTSGLWLSDEVITLLRKQAGE